MSKIEKELSDCEIIEYALRNEKIGLLTEIGKTKTNLCAALGRHTEAEMEFFKSQFKLDTEKGKQSYGVVSALQAEIEKWKKQLEALWRRLEGLEKARKEFKEKELKDICIPIPEVESNIITQ